MSQPKPTSTFSAILAIISIIIIIFTIVVLVYIGGKYFFFELPVIDDVFGETRSEFFNKVLDESYDDPEKVFYYFESSDKGFEQTHINFWGEHITTYDNAYASYQTTSCPSNKKVGSAIQGNNFDGRVYTAIIQNGDFIAFEEGNIKASVVGQCTSSSWFSPSPNVQPEKTTNPDTSSFGETDKITIKIPAIFVNPEIDPQIYIDRYNNKPEYREWFDTNYPQYDSIEQAVGISTSSESSEGGCLIATATYGSEMALEVQQLREIRDNSLLQTKSGTQFMQYFNDVYYSFSPYIADYERENPVFKEMVKLAITPMISSLSILNYVDMDSEESVLGYGISLIILNVAMYVGIPILAVMRLIKNN